MLDPARQFLGPGSHGFQFRYRAQVVFSSLVHGFGGFGHIRDIAVDVFTDTGLFFGRCSNLGCCVVDAAHAPVDFGQGGAYGFNGLAAFLSYNA